MNPNRRPNKKKQQGLLESSAGLLSPPGGVVVRRGVGRLEPRPCRSRPDQRFRSSTPTFTSSIPRVRRAPIFRPGGARVTAALPCPERYRRLAVPLGVVGAIKVEASPWIEDNLWVLEVAQRDPIMVGVIGNLEPDKPEFRGDLRALPQESALPRDPLRKPLGTRHHEAVGQPGFHRRPQASRPGGPRAGHGQSARAAARSHAPHQRRRAGASHRARSSAEPRSRSSGSGRLRRGAAGDRQAPADLREALRDHPPRQRSGVNRARHVSRAPGHADGCVRRGPRPVRQRLAEQRRRGADRQGGRGGESEYFLAKPRPVAEKYFWKNSLAAYKWVKREPSQPALR